MIIGNTTWEAKLAAMPQKKPLYYLHIEGFNVYVLSFDPTAESVATGGGYGTAYGTAYGSD